MATASAIAHQLGLGERPTSPSEPGVMRRKPRRPDAGLLTPLILWRILFVSFLFAGISLGVYFWALDRGRDLETARTMVVNMLVVLEIFYLFSVRYLQMTSFTLTGVKGTNAVLIGLAAVVLGQLAFTYLPFMNTILGSRPLQLYESPINQLPMSRWTGCFSCLSTAFTSIWDSPVSVRRVTAQQSGRNLRGFCGTCCDSLCSVMQNMLWMLTFK
ncbi:MAG: cation transporting ATPase C-terminal domain-containing protein [Chromatocurvus sp.]